MSTSTSPHPMKKNSLPVKRKITQDSMPKEVFDSVVSTVSGVSRTFSVTVEYGHRNIRTLSFSAQRGIKALKEHVKTTCPNWVRVEVEMPKGNRAVFRNPKAVKVIS